MRRSKPSRPASNSAINQADRRRYYDFRSGMSTAEIATRDRVTVAAVERSIQRCRSEVQQYSQESAEVEVRKHVLSLLPDSVKAISRALQATKKETVSVVVEGEEMEETVDVPDHKTQLSGNSALIELLTSIKVSSPMVNVDARTQTQNVLGVPNGAGGQPSSAEAVIREIRAARGLALTDGATIEGSGNVAAMQEVDTELAAEMEEFGDDEDIQDAEELDEDDNG